MRVVVTGATGNVGTAVLRALEADPGVDEVVGIARRVPDAGTGKTTYHRADIATDDLHAPIDGADVVIHLAWLIQPSRDEATTHAVNVEGSKRVFEAAAAGAGALVHASSVGAYSPGPKDEPVDESWPTGGIETSFYSRHKAEAERVLDAVEAAHPDLRVARLRPGLIFQAGAAAEIRRYFAGPFLPGALVHPRLLRVVPLMRRLVIQAVHADDIAQAYRLAATTPSASGAFNIAAEPVLDPGSLAKALGAVQVPASPRVLRAFADWTFKLRLQPTPPGWLDLALGVPVMDTTRARTELGWDPQTSGTDALLELLRAMSRGQGADTPALSEDVSRLDEFRSGVGVTNP